ncbi:galactose mutarotase-like [Neocloeon triangulifer]|uniref:galactose mutarotase-like n=1 Tax=Neocloeon triangulifer TaxID=2078957 RepID=UPI00286F0C76|nr:galactose mutarotase-like [Neocloeon triangulifer]
MCTEPERRRTPRRASALFWFFKMSATGPRIEEDSFGTFFDEELKTSVPVRRFTLTNSRNVCVQIINYGATITNIIVPDKNGIFADINLGFDNMEGYTKNWVNPYFGAVVGRVANRIGKAQFSIKGQTFHVSKNIGENHLHGGFKGFDKKIWDANVEGVKVTFSYVSKDGEEGYPGSVLVAATYSLSEASELLLEMTATTTKPTPVNLTNHAYFNLAGHEKGQEGLNEHKVQINASFYTPTVDSIPTGEIKPVAGTTYNLTVPKLLKEVLPWTPDDGFDLNYCVNTSKPPTIVLVAKVTHPPSGRLLEVYSDQPGVQFYSSNNLPSENILQGKGGCFYTKHGAFCLETQNYPDAVNHVNFPKAVLLPGETYRHNVKYYFGIQTEEQGSCTIA